MCIERAQCSMHTCVRALQVTIFFCRGCGRYLQPPRHWVRAELESRELLTFCIKRIRGLGKVTNASISRTTAGWRLCLVQSSLSAGHRGWSSYLCPHSRHACNAILCPSRMVRALLQLKLVDAGFIWTEPHSKRLKVKLTVQVSIV